MASRTIYAGNNFQSVCNRLNGSTTDAGSNTENHLPVGYSSSTDSRWRALIKFPNIAAPIPIGARVVKAEVWLKTTGSTQHNQKGSNTRLKISRCTQSPAFSGGSGEGWYTSANPKGFQIASTTAKTYAAEGAHKDGTVYKYDITEYVEHWLPGNYFKRDGSPCNNGTNNGIELKSYDENSSARGTEFWSTRGGYEPRLVITYTEEDPPGNATNIQPSGDLNSVPTEVTFDTQAGDTAVEYQVRVANLLEGLNWTSGYRSFTPGGNTVADISAAPVGVGYSVAVSIDLRNSVGDSKTSFGGGFYVLPVPSVAISHPPAGGRCHIHNLDEVGVWADGAVAMPRVEVLYMHPTGVSAQVIEVSVDGGTTWHSFPGVASGETAICDVPQRVARNTDFQIRARATGGGGQQSAEQAVTRRLNWAQVVLPWTVSDPNSSNFVSDHASVQGGARVQAAYQYRSTGGGSWVKNPSSLPKDIGGGEMCVRLSTSDTAQAPSVADLKVEWQSTPPAAPDFWTAGAADITLDPQVRRFGVHSMRVACTGTGWVSNDRPVTVSPNTQYTISVYINTLGASIDGYVQLGYLDQNGAGVGLASQSTAVTNDSTGKGKENWQRLYATFTTGPDTTELRPAVYHGTNTPGKEFRLDSMQLESGAIASSWRPGMLGPAVILDVGGIAVDGEVGGLFRLRDRNGHVILLDDDGLEKDGQPYITAADVPAPVLKPPKVTRFTAGGTWTRSAGCLWVDVEVFGAGGGGGGALGHASNKTAASGGGGGGYAHSVLSGSAMPSSATVAVGSGGAGGAAGQNNGSDGSGNSSFVGGSVNMVAEPGLAGESSGSALNQYHAGGVGGNATGGQDSVRGQRGGTSIAIGGTAFPAKGGDNGKGLGGGAQPASWHGADADYYGGGGSGGANSEAASVVNRSGGNGSPGIVIVTEHYQ